MTQLLSADPRQSAAPLERPTEIKEHGPLRLNVGCGQTPTAGWKNYDNSPSVRLARRPILAGLLDRLGLLNGWQKEFIAFARHSAIAWADVTRAIPEADHSVEVIYSSHMLEHLDKADALRFLQEARRVLVPGGIIRLAVPNIGYLVQEYLRHRDADRFIEDTYLTRPKNATLWAKLKYLWIGDRHHVWMYDGDSLCRLLRSVGFIHAEAMAPGGTGIINPGALNLREREPESVFVEAVNP